MAINQIFKTKIIKANKGFNKTIKNLKRSHKISREKSKKRTIKTNRTKILWVQTQSPKNKNLILESKAQVM